MKVETAAEKEREEKEEEALEEVVGRGGRATGFLRVGREEEGEEAAKEAAEEEKTGDQREGGVKKTMLRKGSEQHGQGWTISRSCRAVKGGRRTQRDGQ